MPRIDSLMEKVRGGGYVAPSDRSCSRGPAHALLPTIQQSLKYARAGIMVTALRSAGNQSPLEFFENPHEERHIGTLLDDVSRPGRAAKNRMNSIPNMFPVRHSLRTRGASRDSVNHLTSLSR
jgi:hypothetical protein